MINHYHKLDGIYHNQRSEFVRNLHYMDILVMYGNGTLQPFCWLGHLMGIFHSYPASYYHETCRNLIPLIPMILSQICLKAANRFKLQGEEGGNRHRHIYTYTTHGHLASYSQEARLKPSLSLRNQKMKKTSPVYANFALHSFLLKCL